MNFFNLLGQIRSAHAVSLAIENGVAPSKVHLRKLGIDEIYAKRVKY